MKYLVVFLVVLKHLVIFLVALAVVIFLACTPSQRTKATDCTIKSALVLYDCLQRSGALAQPQDAGTTTDPSYPKK